VRPFATRVSDGAIRVREAGRFKIGAVPADDIFPFRRKELGGGRPAQRPRGNSHEVAESMPAVEQPGAPPVAAESGEPAVTVPETLFGQVVGPLSEPPAQSRRSKLRGWVWLPLSFIFLLLGVVLGFQIAFSYRPAETARTLADPYVLDLSVVQIEDQLHLKWNSEMTVFQSARRGVLHIADGDNTKTVDLSKADLARGGVLYRNSSADIVFSLEIFPRERTSITESVSIHLKSAPAAEEPKQVEPAPQPVEKRKSARHRRLAPAAL
jgi:hypothetical protein